MAQICAKGQVLIGPYITTTSNIPHMSNMLTKIECDEITPI